MVEKTVLAAISKLPDEYLGKYYAIRDLPLEEYENMVENHLLFKGEDKYLETAGI